MCVTVLLTQWRRRRFIFFFFVFGLLRHLRQRPPLSMAGSFAFAESNGWRTGRRVILSYLFAAFLVLLLFLLLLVWLPPVCSRGACAQRHEVVVSDVGVLIIIFIRRPSPFSARHGVYFICVGALRTGAFNNNDSIMLARPLGGRRPRVDGWMDVGAIREYACLTRCRAHPFGRNVIGNSMISATIWTEFFVCVCFCSCRAVLFLLPIVLQHAHMQMYCCECIRMLIMIGMRMDGTWRRLAAFHRNHYCTLFNAVFLVASKPDRLI